MSGWRTALRIARREAWASPGRAALVVVMLMLPMLGGAFLAVAYDSFRLTPAEQVTRTIGAATAAVTIDYDTPVIQDDLINGFASPIDPAADKRPQPLTAVQKALPGVRRAILDRRGEATVIRAERSDAPITTRTLDYTDPVAAGILRHVDGRAPRTNTEVAVNKAAARLLDVGIGAQLRLRDTATGYTVVGVVEEPSQIGDREESLLVAAPGTLPGSSPQRPEQGDRWLLDTDAPVTEAQVTAVNKLGGEVFSRSVVLTALPDRSSEGSGASVESTVGLAAAAVLCLLEVIMLAGPAFAIGARRRSRELAMLSVAGANPRQVRQVVLADGVILGTLGAITGVALGVLTAVLAQPLLEQHVMGTRAGAFRAFPLAIAALAVLTVGIGVLAALVPAISVSRQDPVVALGGQRGITRSRRRYVVLGAVLLAGGLGTAFTGAFNVNVNLILVGILAFEVGVVLASSAIIGAIATLARFLPLAPRLALRDVARNRTAAAPAIAAVLAVTAGSVVVGLYLQADAARQYTSSQPAYPIGSVQLGYRPEKGGPPLASLVQEARRVLPVTAVTKLTFVSCTPSENSYCSNDLVMAPQHRCPISDSDTLSPAQEKAALADKRCSTPQRSVRGYSLALVDDGRGVAALTGAGKDDAVQAAAALAAGKAVVSDSRYVDNGYLTIRIEGTTGSSEQNPEGKPFQRDVRLPAYVLRSGFTSEAILPPTAIGRTGLTAETDGVLLSTTRTPTPSEEQRLTDTLQRIASSVGVDVSRDAPVTTKGPVLIVALIAGLITLGATAVATGLAAIDGRATLTTLGAVGASPRVRRTLALSRTAVIAGLGSLLGAAVGTGIGTLLLYAFNRAALTRYPVTWPYPLNIPWTSLLIAVIAIPVLAVLGAALFTRTHLPAERRTT